MAIISNIGPIYTGEDVLLSFTMSPVVNISGWALLFTVKLNEMDAASIFSVAGTIVSGPAGTFTVSLTAANTTLLKTNQYVWDVWRTDVGSAVVIALGKLNVRDTARVP